VCSTTWGAVERETRYGQPASFEMESRSERATLRVSGEIDVATEPAFRRALDAVVTEAHSPAVVDLSRVTFIDARGLSALVAKRQEVSGTDVTLVLLDPSPWVRRLLETTGLDQSFDIESSEGEQR
jgi:anti-sigma B factor antagonist